MESKVYTFVKYSMFIISIIGVVLAIKLFSVHSKGEFGCFGCEILGYIAGIVVAIITGIAISATRALWKTNKDLPTGRMGLFAVMLLVISISVFYLYYIDYKSTNNGISELTISSILILYGIFLLIQANRRSFGKEIQKQDKNSRNKK